MRSTSKEVIDIVCVEETSGKETLSIERSLSIEALTKMISKSQESLKNNIEPKQKLSGLSVRLRKMSDTTSNIVKRKFNTQGEIRSRSTSFADTPRQRKVSVQPDFTIGSVSVLAEKRVRKGSLQPNMLIGDRRDIVKKDLSKGRKMSVPANMKYNTERVRVRRVSFINQNTGEAFQMKEQ